MDSFRYILYVYKRTLLRANDDGKRMEKPVIGASGGGKYHCVCVVDKTMLMRLLATGFAGREVRIGLVDGHQGSSLTVALPCTAVDGSR